MHVYMQVGIMVQYTLTLNKLVHGVSGPSHTVNPKKQNKKCYFAVIGLTNTTKWWPYCHLPHSQ